MSESEEMKLERLFRGLQVGLDSLRNVRALYNERVAFEFNSIKFFWPNENKMSEILAFFLNPAETHGQKTAFLSQFLKQFKIEAAEKLVEDGHEIKVTTETPTEERRRVDITIEIGRGDYMIGIENKIWAADQPKQLSAYIAHLKQATGPNKDAYTLFYLSPDGHSPSEGSLTKEEQDSLKNQLQIISYGKDIIELLGCFESVCKADNVRAFIRDFRQYLKEKFKGERVMGDQKFLTEYLKKNPELFPEVPAIHVAYQEIRDSINAVFRHAIQKHLTMMAGKDDFTQWPVVENDDELHYDSDLPKETYFVFQGGAIGLYFGADKDNENDSRHKISQDGLAKMRNSLRVKVYGPDVLPVDKGCPNWLIQMQLPATELTDDAIAGVLKKDASDYDSSTSSLQTEAKRVADAVWRFIADVESEWKDAGLPTKASEKNL